MIRQDRLLAKKYYLQAASKAFDFSWKREENDSPFGIIAKTSKQINNHESNTYYFICYLSQNDAEKLVDICKTLKTSEDYGYLFGQIPVSNFDIEAYANIPDDLQDIEEKTPTFDKDLIDRFDIIDEDTDLADERIDVDCMDVTNHGVAITLYNHNTDGQYNFFIPVEDLEIMAAGPKMEQETAPKI